MLGSGHKKQTGRVDSVLASSSGESKHDPPHGCWGRPIVVMGTVPRHGEPWCLSSQLSSALRVVPSSSL